MNIHNIPYHLITLNYPKSAAMGFFQGTQEQVRNNRSKRAINVRSTEGLLNIKILFKTCTVSGHKYVIKFRIPIDLRVFPCLLFNFL